MTMTVAQSVLTILAGVAATMLTRFLPFLIFPEGKTPPAAITYLGSVLPYAVIGLLVVYCLKDLDLLGSNHGLPQIISVGVVAVLHKWKHNTLLSILGGTLCNMILFQTIFAV